MAMNNHNIFGLSKHSVSKGFIIRFVINFTLVISLLGGISPQVSDPISRVVKTEQIESNLRSTQSATYYHQHDRGLKTQLKRPYSFHLSSLTTHHFVQVALRHNKTIVNSFETPSLISTYIPRSMVDSSSLS